MPHAPHSGRSTGSLLANSSCRASVSPASAAARARPTSPARAWGAARRVLVALGPALLSGLGFLLSVWLYYDYLQLLKAAQRTPAPLTAYARQWAWFSFPWLCLLIVVPTVWAVQLYRRSVEVRGGLPECSCEANRPAAEGKAKALDATEPGVLIASIEHVVPLHNISAAAGGLGKAMKMYHKHALLSKRKFKFVFPMIGDQQYTGFTPVEPILDGSVEVSELNEGPSVQFIALNHPLFRERSRTTMYPDSRRPQQFITFYSLWNKCIAELLLRYRDRGEVGIYHCMDYHGGLAPLFIEEWGLPLVPVALTLHNASHQGALLSVLSASEWELLIKSLGLSHARETCSVEGDFNMLSAIVKYIERHQGGQGVRAVSHKYSLHLKRSEPMFCCTPIEGHPNPMLDIERPSLPDGPGTLITHKAACKARVQRDLNLIVNPDAPVFAFVGRWTYEKGIDLLADTLLWLLSTHPTAQESLIALVVGPIGDEAGQYSALRLAMATTAPSIARRLFVRTEFFKMTADMRFAVDFCFCPSRMEPFGYTDIEFAWHGALCLGHLAGGLGKVPGIYYTSPDAGDRNLQLGQLKRAVLRALDLSTERLHEASMEAVLASFSFEDWSSALDAQYCALHAFAAHAPKLSSARSGTLNGRVEITMDLSACSNRGLGKHGRALSLMPFRPDADRTDAAAETAYASLLETKQLTSESLAHVISMPIIAKDKSRPWNTPTMSEVTTKSSGWTGPSPGASSYSDSDGKTEEEGLPTTIDPDDLLAAVESEVVAALFTPSGRRNTDVDDLITKAHQTAAGPLPGTSRFGQQMHCCMRQEIFGSALSNWVVVLLYIFAPSMAFSSFAAIMAEGVQMNAMALYSIQMISAGAGSYIWMALAQRVAPPRLLALVGLAQLSLFLPAYTYNFVHARECGYVAASLQGLAMGAVEPIIIGFNFMDKWVSTTSIAASRMAMAEPARIFINIGILGVLYGKMSQTSHLRLFYTVVLRVCPVFLLVLSWLCLYLPISKDMRLPKIRTKWGAGSQAYWRLVAGDCFGACGSFLEVVIVSSLVKQHTRESGAEGHGFFLRAGFLCGATTLALCLLMSYRHGGGSLLVMSLALLNVPFLVLGGPLVAVADALAGSHLESLLTIALVGNFVKQMAESIVKMRVLPSRWSFITYQAHANLMIHTIASLSPLVLIGATQALAHIAPLVAPGLISSDSTLQDIVDSAEGVTVFAVGAPFAFAKFFYQLPAICDLVDERFVLPFPIRGASLHQ
ncbi:hypothetical protein AB1Y20_012256 [Prymnesium parvum]|uniref:Starch synthase catalytic domain-containing protein n=1 Tax=Prymnesium parvum TaxID=97485 RepID=A0AB34IRA6_PRYPA